MTTPSDWKPIPQLALATGCGERTIYKALQTGALEEKVIDGKKHASEHQVMLLTKRTETTEVSARSSIRTEDPSRSHQRPPLSPELAVQKQLLEKQQLESQINAAEAARLAANEARRRAQEEADERAMAARAKREAQELELQFKRRQFQIDEQKRLADIQWEEEERRRLEVQRRVDDTTRKERQKWSQHWLAEMSEWIEGEVGRHALKRGLDVVRDELARLSPDDTKPFIQRALVSALFDAFFDEIEQIKERENTIRLDRLVGDLVVEFSAGLRRAQADEIGRELRSAAANGVEEVALRFRAASLHRQFLSDLRAERRAEEELKIRQKRADDEAYRQAASARREALEKEDRARRTAQQQQYEVERKWKALALSLQEKVDRALPQGATYADGFDATTAAQAHLKRVQPRLSAEDAEQEINDLIEEHRKKVEERLTKKRESEQKRQEVDRWVNRLPWSVSTKERNEVRSELSQRYDETRGSPEFEEDARALVDEFG